jgi:hypothetical protein
MKWKTLSLAPLERFPKFCSSSWGRGAQTTHQRLGLQQSPAAIENQGARESGRGLPQSKTSWNFPLTLLNKCRGFC